MMQLSSFLFRIFLEVLALALTEEKQIKIIEIEKEVRLLLFAHDMILSIKYPEDAIRKLSEFISEFGKASGYKINLQKSFALTTKKSEIKIREMIPLTIAL